MPPKFSLAMATALLAMCGALSAQTLQNLKHQPPEGAGIGFLLTDGTALFQASSNESDWWKLTPDNTGS